MEREIQLALEQFEVGIAADRIVLYHATNSERAHETLETQTVRAKLDEDSSLTGRPRYLVYLASRPEILDAIPHASVVLRLEVPADTPLEINPTFHDRWLELVYEAPSEEDGLEVSDSSIVCGT